MEIKVCVLEFNVIVIVVINKRDYFLCCRIIQNYAMRDEAGALAPPSMDYNKVIMTTHAIYVYSPFFRGVYYIQSSFLFSFQRILLCLVAIW